MEAIKRWHRECVAKEMIGVLKKKGYNAIYVENVEAVRAVIASLIPEGASVAVGGSVTLNETNVLSDIQNGAYNYIDRYNQPNFEAMCDKYREGLSADYFVTSTNAITKNGELVNIDCTGNRVAAMAFGPKNVIVIAGTNKIVRDINAGIIRAKEVAPLNAKRINHPTPCTEDGKCHDCTCQQRICNITSIIHNCYKWPGRITVILVPENLGY